MRADRTTKHDLQSAIEQLTVAGGRFYGFVLNRLDLNRFGNYYYYHSYYPRYYTADYYLTDTNVSS